MKSPSRARAPNETKSVADFYRVWKKKNEGDMEKQKSLIKGASYIRNEQISRLRVGGDRGG